ncbi:MAG: hypothetical protein KIT09_07145 [Bryobacteraceae bacterium]|nr:hypothetical protein [Bryobacteraceae bacterium]
MAVIAFGIACAVAPEKVRGQFFRMSHLSPPYPEPRPGELLAWRIMGALMAGVFGFILWGIR